ncbi:Chemotaxis protein CheA [Thalassoglobus neptunius]|uniref:Chemotaxis protein CheA n=1 Tax=Thalassoglobus neptunius TaxID=1938619 RepID=A0A5C5X5C0_9PLAN|nr:response regulator [Thalassoglobus neptunius]TWT58124.1 Chemotaxis protein CheA [Thalassoglobus neptunius]
MIDSGSQESDFDKSSDRQKLETLRDRCVGLATTAADAGADEIAVVASTLTDLVSIAQTSADFDDESSPAKSISEYCQNTLPHLESALAAFPSTDDVVSAILDDIEATWGEYLDLLSEHERFRTSADAEWGGASASSWDASSSIDEDIEDDSDDPKFEQIDVSAILTSLDQLPKEIPDEAPKPAPPQHLFSDQKPSEANSAPPQIENETIDDPELLTAYVDDAQNCLASMENCLLELDNAEDSIAPLQQFCRELHTLKGASATVGLSGLASYLHGLENDVEAMTREGASVNTDLLLEGVDSVRRQLEQLLTGQESTPDPEDKRPVQNAPQLDSGFSASPEGVVRLETSRLDRLMDLLAELVMLRNRRDTYVNSLQELHHEVNSCATRIRVIDTLSLMQQQKRETGLTTSSTGHGRSLQSQLQDLNSLLSEISKDVGEIGRTMSQICDPLAQDNFLISHLIGRFRSEMLELRRQPVASLFRRLQRVAREASKFEQKPVELILHGEGTRAERSLQDRLYEPLMHMVRNAICHGIESDSDRQKLGKPATGKIHLKAWSDATSLYIEVRDDGRGLSEEKLEKKGREMGLIRVGEQASRQELWKLILQPGFSTKQEVNQISGRGVGMDVVASQIREMRGRLDIDSVSGQFTSIRMQIPLRSTIEHAMVVKVGERLFALPMHSIAGTEAEESEVSDSNLVSLQFLLGLDGVPGVNPRVVTLRQQAKEQGLSGGGTSADSNLSILVDAVVGVEEVVVRSLPPMLANHDCFSGVTLSGQAEMVMVLDVPRLVEYGLTSREAYAEFAENNTPEAHKRRRLAEVRKHGLNSQNLKILVVDDSLSVRRSLVKKLHSHGFETIEASDGIQAMNLLRTSDCVGIVSDVDMPRMNGIDFLAEVRRLNRYVDLPFVVVTSRQDEESVSSLEALGANRIFTKPVSDSMVKMIVRTIREHNRNHSLVTS